MLFALHKLIVYGEREGAFVAKSSKDLLQATSLIKLLKERRPWEIESAWLDITKRGKGWVTRVKHGVNALSAGLPRH